MTNITTANIEWDSLRIPDESSSEEEEKQSALISEYLSRSEELLSVNPSIDKVTEIEVDDSLLEMKELDFNKISNQELFNYFQNENKETHQGILFPKTDEIHSVFWFLHNLNQEEIKNTKVTISNPEEVSIVFYLVIEAASFLAF